MNYWRPRGEGIKETASVAGKYEDERISFNYASYGKTNDLGIPYRKKK